MSVVLDSSALIAIIKLEPGAETAEEELDGGYVSTVILAECLTKLANQGFRAADAERRFRAAGIRIEPFTEADVRITLSLHALAYEDISLADRMCLALAIRLGLPCLTGDRAWRKLHLPIEIRLFR